MNEAPNKGSVVTRAWSYISQAWLVILLALLYGGALAGVQGKLGPLIEDNKREETYSKIPGLVGISEPAGDADKKRIEIKERPVTGQRGKKKYRVYQAFVDGELKGWVLPASGLGFADRIEVLIGLDAELSTITGLWVLDQKETPGLGDNITSPELFLDQFAEKSAKEELEVVKVAAAAGSNQIRALTGATISSDSVAEIVNKAIQNLREPIRKLSLDPPAGPDSEPSERGD